MCSVSHVPKSGMGGRDPLILYLEAVLPLLVLAMTVNLKSLQESVQFSSVQFSRSVVSDSLRPHESQHARPPCPSPTPQGHPNPCLLSLVFLAYTVPYVRRPVWPWQDKNSLLGREIISVQFSSVAQSCPTLCDPMNCSMPGFLIHHQLPELAQTHVYRVGDAIQPSHPLSSPSPPAFNLSQHQGLFQ